MKFPTRYTTIIFVLRIHHLPTSRYRRTPALEPLCDPLSDRRPPKVLVYNPGLSLPERSILSFPFSSYFSSYSRYSPSHRGVLYGVARRSSSPSSPSHPCRLRSSRESLSGPKREDLQNNPPLVRETGIYSSLYSVHHAHFSCRSLY